MQVLNSFQTQEIAGGFSAASLVDTLYGTLALGFIFGGVYAGYNELGFLNTVLVFAGAGVALSIGLHVLVPELASTLLTHTGTAMVWGRDGCLSYGVGKVVNYFTA